MGALGLIVDIRCSGTHHYSALRRETFLALLPKKESPYSSPILLHVVQALRAKTMTGILAQV